MNKNKLGTIFIISILALAGIGISYAGFTDMINVYGEVNTATVELNVVDYSGTWLFKVWGEGAPTNEIMIISGIYNHKDYTGESWGDYLIENELNNYENVELVSYAYAKKGTNDYDVDMIFYNIFPCIEYKADVYIHYDGSIPAYVNVTDFIYPTIFDREDLWDWEFRAEKGVKDDSSVYDYTKTALPVQLHKYNQLYLELMLHMLQPADVNTFQGKEYTFSFKINAIQWNDHCEEPECISPLVPIDPLPAHESINIAYGPTLKLEFKTGHESGETIQIEIYLSKDPDPINNYEFYRLSEHHSMVGYILVSAIYILDTELLPDTTYFWQVVVKADCGAETFGPVWMFTTKSYAIPISNWCELNAIRNNLNANYVLINDLDENSDCYNDYASPNANAGSGWLPIGTGAAGNSFTGTFDGNNYKISKLFIDRSINNVGLFGHIDGATIRNVGLVDVNINGNQYTGGLVGTMDGSSVVSNSYATGTVTGTNMVGGLVGNMVGSSMVSNSYATGTVTGTQSHVGGLVGNMVGSSVVSNSYATGTVTSTGNSVGGLVGHMSVQAVVSNSYATGNAKGNLHVGGLVGWMAGGTITDLPMVNNSYATGNVKGTKNVGGFVGNIARSASARPVITNSYANGTVTRVSGTETNFGGFVGNNFRAKIINCYGTGSVHYTGVTDPTDKGFAGIVTTGDGYEMSGNFWDTQTSGQTSTAGGATGKTTNEMQNYNTFNNAGWNIAKILDWINEIWSIDDGNNYPRLGWEL